MIGKLWFILLMAPIPVEAQSLTGSWQGYWIRAGDSMLVTLTIRRDSSTGRYAATFDSDRLRVSGIPFTDVAVQGCCDVTITLRGDRTTAVFKGQLSADSLTGTLEESDARTRLENGRFAYGRVRTPRAPLEEREIRFTSGEATLAGTLLMPREGNDLAAVVFLHGSGAEGRWASRFLATRLAERGVAALIFDKRGVGESTGDWRRAGIDDLTSDGAAAVARLRQEPRIDSRRIGVHGHSQGGTLAPLVAARAPEVGFVIGSAAAGLPMDSVEIFSVLNSLYPSAPSAQDSADARDYIGELVAVAYHQRPRARLDSLAGRYRDRSWFIAPPPADNLYWLISPMFAPYRALDWWSRVRVPVLLLYGAEDQRVPAAASAERIAAALRGAGNSDVTIRLYPGADHTFRLPPGPGGWPATAPGYLSELLDWIAKR